MSKWHETRAANVALRLGGALSLGLAWFAGSTLFNMIHARPAGDATVLDMLLAGAAFLASSAGLILLFVGPGLFEQVTISERWARRLPGPVPREFEPMLCRDLAPPEGDQSSPKDRVSQHDGESAPVRYPHLSSARRW